MANKILQIDLQNDITPQIGSYDNAGGVTPNNWRNNGGVYSLGPTNTDGTTPYYWFTPTKEVTDFDLCWEDYQDHEQTTPQYHLEIGDNAGNVVLSVRRVNANYSIGPVGVGNLAYQTWHKMLVEVRKASANSSTVTAYVDGKKIDTGTSGTLLTSAKIALLGHVPNIGYWQNAGQRLRYVTIYDRSYTSKGINLDGMMTTITGFVNKLKGALSTVAFSGSYNDLSNKPTISTVNNGTLTIQKNGTNVQTFTANSSTNKTANITVPTKTSDLTNDSGFITSDNTKIPLAGSNAISGSLIPATTDAYDLGDSSYQWNQAYVKSLTINGVACGDILTHNVSEFVNVTSAQTIGGVKTFSSNMVIQGSKKVTCNLDNSFIELDGGTTWGKGGSIVLSGQDRSSYTNSVLIVSKSDANTDILQYQNGELKPLSNNTNNPSLGTSTNQWASVYAQTYYYNGTEFLNKFVTTDTEQSISQVKEFTRTNSDTLRLKNGRVALGETISSDAYTQFVFRDKNTDNLAYIRDIYYTDGSTTLAFYARNKYANGAPSTTGSVSYAYLGIGVDATGKPSASVRGDFAPYSDATYNLGTSTNKWSKVYSDDVVHTTGSETISGEKTFSNLRTYFGRDISLYSVRKYGKNLNPTSNSYQYLNFSGNLASDGSTNDWSSGYIEQVVDTNGGSRGRWFIQDTSENAMGIELWSSGNDKQLRPYQNGNTDLGTSTKKWRDVNTILLNGKTPAYNDDVIPRSGGAVITDYFLGRSVDTGSLMISGGTSWSSGGSLETFGSGHSSNAGQVRLQPALSNSNFKTMNLEPSGTWTWSGTACQITSDQRFKQQISNIDDKLLDAWEDVDLVQFKYNDAVEEKSDNARLHTGYVVQQIDDACKSHGVDVSKYGLYCYEEYAEETREVEHEDGTKTTEVVKPASEHYSLRYTEALIVECAYLRKCIKELRTEIEELKSSK